MNILMNSTFWSAVIIGIIAVAIIYTAYTHFKSDKPAKRVKKPHTV